MNTLLVIFLVLYAGVLPGSTNEAQQTTASTTMTASTTSAVTTATSSKPTSTDTSSSPNGTTDSMQSQTASTSDKSVSGTAHTDASSVSVTAVATTGNTTTSTTHASTSQGVSSTALTNVSSMSITAVATTGNTTTSITHASTSQGVISTSDTHASIMSVTSLTTTNDSSPSAPHATDNTSVTHASTTPMPASASIPDITQTSNTSLATTEASPCGNYTITQEENYLMISLDPPSNVSVRYNYNGKSDTTLIVDKGRINEFEPCTAVEITEVSRNSCTFYGQRTITTNFTNFTFTDVDVTEGNTTLTFGWNTTVEPQKCKIVYTINCTNGTHYSLKNITKKENTLDGLNPYTNYTCIWNAFFENVSIKTEKKNTMTDVGKPDKPWAIVAIPGQQNMSLTWNSPNKTHGPIHGYTVCWQGQHSCQKNCKNSNTTKISTGDCLSPYTDYNVSVAAYNVMKNQIQLTGISETLLKRTKSAKPDAVEIQDIIYKTKNEVHVPCKGGKKNGPNQFFILLEESNLIQKMNATNCSFHLRDLDYLTTYRIQIYANNGEHDGIKAIKTFSTGYNDKALIGFLAFLIIVTSIALLIVLYKIYLLQRKASGSSDESLELIDRDDEKQLMNIDPISCERLLEAYRNKIADEGRLFLAEFQSIPRIFSKYSAKEARKPYNQTKNRYVDILPYDINRVQLTQVSGEPGSDYINASHIDGFKEPRKYIAAQGPKDETVDDFWKMIWEQQSTIIVMVTRCEEGNRNKCAEYWPTLEKGTKTFGDILVTISEEKRCPDYIIRKLHVTNKKEKSAEREVNHIQFTSWPDHGVPDDPHLLLKLRRRVNGFSSLFSGPIVVHCSAGVGRTGTYIGIDAMMESLEAEGRIDVYGYVVKLRRQRCLMVQVEAQYILIHQALLEHNQFGETEVPLNELSTELPAMLEQDPPTDPSVIEAEYQRLPTYKNWRSQNAGRDKENESKNRYAHIIPYDYNRVLIKTDDEKSKESEQDNENESDESSDEDSDNEDTKYINASFMNGYWGPRAVIATQGPLQETVADFWLMLYQRKTKAIVMLTECTEGEENFSIQYWTDENKKKQTYGDIEVNFCEIEESPGFTIRTMEIRHTKRKEARKIYHYHYHTWCGKEFPDDPENLISMIRSVKQKIQHKVPVEEGAYEKAIPVLIHCSDGSTRTGIACALWNLLDCADTEKVVDIFQTVKTLRRERIGLFSSFEHYKFLYEIIAKTYPAQNGDVKTVNRPQSTTVEVINENNKQELSATAVDNGPNITNPNTDENKSSASTEETSETKSSTNEKTEQTETSANGPTS